MAATSKEMPTTKCWSRRSRSGWPAEKVGVAPNQPMKLTGPASRLFETQRRCSRPGNLSWSFGEVEPERLLSAEAEAASRQAAEVANFAAAGCGWQELRLRGRRLRIVERSSGGFVSQTPNQSLQRTASPVVVGLLGSSHRRPLSYIVRPHGRYCE